MLLLSTLSALSCNDVLEIQHGLHLAKAPSVVWLFENSWTCECGIINSLVPYTVYNCINTLLDIDSESHYENVEKALIVFNHFKDVPSPLLKNSLHSIVNQLLLARHPNVNYATVLVHFNQQDSEVGHAENDFEGQELPARKGRRFGHRGGNFQRYNQHDIPNSDEYDSDDSTGSNFE